VLQSRAEMELQLRDLEYKLGAADRKNMEAFGELNSQIQDLARKMADENSRSDENDAQLIGEIQAFESQVGARLLKQKHVSRCLIRRNSRSVLVLRLARRCQVCT